MTEHRPRPNDHLVEPLFGGLSGAHDRSRELLAGSRPGGAGHRVWLVVATILAGGLLFWWRA